MGNTFDRLDPSDQTNRTDQKQRAFSSKLQAVRYRNWKLHFENDKPSQLYDLQADIGEQNNLIQSYPDVVKRLQSHVHKFATELAQNSRPAGFVKNPKPLSK